MSSNELDQTDRGILYLLQEDARNNTTESIGERVGVSASTVGTRIRKMEDQSIVTGYEPRVDYENAGIDHHLLIVGTVPFDRRDEVGESLLEVHGVVHVRELLTSSQNVSIEIIGERRRDIEDSLERLDALGVDFDRVEMIGREHSQPFNHFGKEVIADE